MNEAGKHNFLRQVAVAAYNYYEGNLEDVTFVFPNRRSGLFFQRYLGEEITKPIFSPKIVTITQLFEKLAALTPSDSFDLLLNLYLIYKEQTGLEESFDSFMFWGQMLLADFDDIAKYDVDAQLLFANLMDLKVLDSSFDYLTDEQKQLIRTFWEQFDGGRFDSKARSKFVEIWKHLADIMRAFNDSLLLKKQAYPGLIQREAITALEGGMRDAEVVHQKVVFVGFNALTLCEHRLFTYYKKYANTLFFWDYNGPFLSDESNIASKFKRDNLHDFPQILTWEHSSSDTEFSLVALPSLIGQAQYVRKTLAEDISAGKTAWLDTAVVLPEEALLMPVLQAVPAEIQRINVTMGYPLASTDVMSFLELLFDLRRKQSRLKNGMAFYHKTVVALLKHKYLSLVSGQLLEDICKDILRENRVYVPREMMMRQDSPLLYALFACDAEVSDLQFVLSVWKVLMACVSQEDGLQEEKIYLEQAYAITQRLTDLLAEHQQVILQRETLYGVLKQYMRSATIPFRGEPLDGLQVMGLLETRALDFKKVIILAANEGYLPRMQNANSFIPYNLRKGYGLPTFEEHDAIMAYNFYRLISNAEQVHLVYDNRTSRENTNELSRYVWQLKYQYNLPLQEKVLATDVKLTDVKNFSVENADFIQKELNKYCLPIEKGGRSLSASALKTFLDCSMRFYFAYICRLKEADEVKEEIEADMFGTIYHEVMENIYKPYVGKIVEDGDVRIMRTEVDALLNRVYAINVLKNKSGELEGELEGSHSLILRVIKEYVLKQLDNDAKDTPFQYLAPEKKFARAIDIENGQRWVNLVGYVDRIDSKGDEIRIIDYKTGKVDALTFNQIEDIFNSELGDKRPAYALQTMLYAWFYMREYGHTEGKRIVPYIASLRSFYSDTPLRGLMVAEDKNLRQMDDYVAWNDQFETALRNFLEKELFAQDLRFKQVEDTQVCEHCPFVDLCGR